MAQKTETISADFTCSFTDISRFVFNEISSPLLTYTEILDNNNRIDTIFSDLKKHAKKTKIYIIDLESLLFDIEDISENIIKLKKDTGLPIIIFAQNYSDSNSLISALRINGLKLFVTAELLTDLKEELLQAIDDSKNLEDFKKTSSQKITMKDKPYKTINFFGSIPHSGTTTQAIQLIKSLEKSGHKACYIEMSEQGKIEQLGDFFVTEIFDRPNGYVRYQNVDMYFKPLLLKEKKLSEYSICIYDYGTWSENVKLSLLYADMHLCVGSTKTWDVHKLDNIVDSIEMANLIYLFPFVTSEEKNHLIKYAENANIPAYFPAYTPNMFDFSSKNKKWHKIIISNIFSNSSKIHNFKKIFATKRTAISEKSNPIIQEKEVLL